MNQAYSKSKKQLKCSRCQGTEFEPNEQGDIYCVGCGIIHEQSKFDNNVVFGEQRQLQGKNINRQEKFNQLSSQRRLKRAANKIEDLVQKLEIPQTYDKAIQAAHRLLRYADNCNFFKKGKRIELYAAAALYITLRFQKAPYLLIDFSDKMGIKMFPLARCFLKMSKKFGFQQELPLIDPSLFIHRYCKMMNLGDKTEAVTMSAIRLIKRMKRDWMCQGRRPSSLCGAAILIATKIHGVSNSHCSTTQICKTVFVCDETIRRRLDQFKQTKISKLTLEEFEREDEILGTQSEMDPPAFRKARLRSEQENEIMKQAVLVSKKKNPDYDEFLEEEIPEQIILKYSDEIAKNYERASDRIAAIQQAIGEENQLDQDLESNNTGGRGQLAEEEEDNSDIDQKLIFLDQKQQEDRKKIWEEYNRAWLDKQAAKAERGQIEVKKKEKQSKNEQKSDNPFEALLKNPGMGEKVNKDELKKLLASQPKLEDEQTPKMSLTKIFDPYRWSKL